MNPLEITKQMIDFNKASFENTFNAMIMVQDQMERTVIVLMEQATWLPGEGKKAIHDSFDAFKKARGEFKKTVDESIAKVEAFFTEAMKQKA